jgi:hypothetical protein
MEEKAIESRKTHFQTKIDAIPEQKSDVVEEIIGYIDAQTKNRP